MNSTPKALETANNSTEERLAQLTGFNEPPAAAPAESGAPSPSPSPLLSDDDVEEQLTRHSFASSPLSKLVFVAGAMLLAVFLASLFLSQFQSPGEPISADKPAGAEEEEQSPLLSAEERDREKSELLSELALREQQERLRDLEEREEKRRAAPPEPQGKPPARAVQAPQTPTRPSTRPSPQPLRQPRPRPQPVPVRYWEPVRPQPLARRFPAADRMPSAKATQPDPTELWAELAQVGSFGDGMAIATPAASGRAAPKYEPKAASPKSNKALSGAQTPEAPLPSPNLSSDDAIPFGQSVPAVLSTTIAWESSRGSKTEVNSDDRYTITLDRPLQDNSGMIQVPAGSQLVVRLEGGSRAIANLTVESIIIDGVETKLPQGALKVRGEKGQPLTPEMKVLGGNSRDDAEALTDLLSIAGDFADIPGSRSLSSLYRTLTGGRNQRSGATATVFFLRQGTPLEVFVNKPFSIKPPDKPLELDLSSIQPQERSIPPSSTEEGRND